MTLSVGSREVGSREVGSREVGSREVGSREVGIRVSGQVGIKGGCYLGKCACKQMGIWTNAHERKWACGQM